jgi:hypothetical protein
MPLSLLLLLLYKMIIIIFIVIIITGQPMMSSPTGQMMPMPMNTNMMGNNGKMMNQYSPNMMQVGIRDSDRVRV